MGARRRSVGRRGARVSRDEGRSRSKVARRVRELRRQPAQMAIGEFRREVSKFSSTSNHQKLPQPNPSISHISPPFCQKKEPPS